MRLFKRKPTETEMHPCPRCSQLVDEAHGSTCPMCGWDLHEAYQGPTRARGRDTPLDDVADEERFRHGSRDSVT